MVKDVKMNEAPLKEASKDCNKNASKGVVILSSQDKMTLGELWKSDIFEVMGW